MRRFNDPDENSTAQAPVFRRNKRIIVAQHGSHGSWKMAYADFATSMMAFFLAMWLINMTDERAKDIIANYFNPIKLVKTSPAKKGLSDEKVVDSSTVSDPEAKQGNGIRLKKRTKKASKKFDETQIMQNPFETIDKVAAEGPESKAVHLGLANNIFKPKSVDFLDSNKAKSGEKIIDKYIADLYGDSLEEHLAQAQSTKTPNEDSNKTATDTQASLDDHKPSLAQKMEPGKETKNLIAAKKPQSPSAEKRKEVIAPEVKAKKELSAKNSKIETEIKQNLQNIVTSSKQTDLPNISMKSDKQGLHILLSDKKNVGLFSVGSTKPNKATIAVLANIAKKLNNKPVKIIINGYTDARPYKSHFYDNWQLSTARAQMAYYMLLRGGLKKSLVDHIAGYADTKLYNKADPYAAENRRIDILVVPMSGAEDKAEKPTSSGL